MVAIKIRGALLLIGLCTALNLAIPSYSAESDFSVAPSRVDLMIKPSQKVSMHFNLTNYGDPHTFIPRFANGAPDSTGGTLQLSKTARTPVSFTFANGRRDVGDPVFLKTNESVNIPVTLETVGGEEKDYYYFFLAEIQPAGAREGKTSAQLTPRIGVPVIVSLTNTGDRELKSSISVFRVKADYSFTLFGREITLVETGSAVPVYLSVSNLGSN
ncbi:hypothetical protein HYS00_02215, partial [Candidatus Microgenomates bacterium]|nr:hypothetical protein [Candidatus Microgenomates bacterium]